MEERALVNVVNNGKVSQFEWKLENFSISKRHYCSPDFKFEGESWYLRVFPNSNDEYIHLRLAKKSTCSPMKLEFSISLKTTEGRKIFQRRKRKCFGGFEELGYYDVQKWINTSEFRNRQREFMSSGYVTILLTMKKVDSKESKSAKAAAASSRCKDSLRGDKISLDRKFLEKLVKCPQCEEVLNLKNWLDHVCQMANAKTANSANAGSRCTGSIYEDKISFLKDCLSKILHLKPAANSATAGSRCTGSIYRDKISFLKDCLSKILHLKPAARSEAVCSCCKKRLHEDKTAFHKECLEKEAKCPRCDEVVSLRNWFDPLSDVENVSHATSTGELIMVCDHDKILQDLNQLLLNQEHSDVVLRVNGREFPAHKNILSARSPVFASIFRHEMKEKETGIVDIEDCDVSVIPDFLRFLYSNDTVNLSGENVFGLFTIADKYDCQDLRVKCVNFIKENVTIETFCKALALALLHSEVELLRVATDFFIENANKILVTIEWQTFAAENVIYCNELFIKYVDSACVQTIKTPQSVKVKKIY